MIETPPERPIVLDTKWKRLESGKKTLGVEESDVYQMLAYARAYGAARLVLLYPWDHEMREAEGVIRAWTVAAADSRTDFNCRLDIATIDVGRPDRNRVAGILRTIVGFVGRRPSRLPGRLTATSPRSSKTTNPTTALSPSTTLGPPHDQPAIHQIRR